MPSPESIKLVARLTTNLNGQAITKINGPAAFLALLHFLRPPPPTILYYSNRKLEDERKDLYG